MITKVFGIRDIKAGAYGTPFFSTTVGVAQRMFTDLVNDPKTTVSRYPSDFTLYELGTVDDVTGVLTSLKDPHCLDTAAAVKSRVDSVQP